MIRAALVIALLGLAWPAVAAPQPSGLVALTCERGGRENVIKFDGIVVLASYRDRDGCLRWRQLPRGGPR